MQSSLCLLKNMKVVEFADFEPQRIRQMPACGGQGAAATSRPVCARAGLHALWSTSRVACRCCVVCGMHRAVSVSSAWMRCPSAVPAPPPPPLTKIVSVKKSDIY